MYFGALQNAVRQPQQQPDENDAHDKQDRCREDLGQRIFTEKLLPE